MKILVIEDDTEIAEQLKQCIEEAGFVVHNEYDGENGHFEGEEGNYDCILLDVGLPQMDGLTVLEKWRAEGKTTPVILLTARNSKMETIRGLEAGADDYITKPFDMEEVIARIRANIRRHTGKNTNIFSYGNASLDTRSGRMTVDGRFVKLTRIEFLIVQYLFLHQGRPISVNELVEHTYDDFDNDSGIVARHIANIRKKIGADVIKTEANRGYYIPYDHEK